MGILYFLFVCNTGVTLILNITQFIPQSNTFKMANASTPNWLGLLRWSVFVNDGTAPSQFTTMPEEDKKWLEKVMTEVVRSDPQRMDEIMTKVKEFLTRWQSVGEGESVGMSEEEEETLVVDLEDLRDIVEQIDMAQVFCKFGGCELLLQLGESTGCVLSVRCLAVAVIGTVAQNNPTAQEILFAQPPQQPGQLMARLCALMRAASQDVSLFLLARKAMFAVSAVVRGHAAAEEFFVLTELLPTASALLPNPTLRPKLYFLASALIGSDSCSEERTIIVTKTLLMSLLNLSAPTFATSSSENSAAASSASTYTIGTEAESLEFGLVLLRDLLQTRVGQTLLLSSDNPAAVETVVGATISNSASVQTSMAIMRQVPLPVRLNRALQRWRNSLYSEDHSDTSNSSNTDNNVQQVEENEGHHCDLLRQHLQQILQLIYVSIDNNDNRDTNDWQLRDISEIPVKYPRTTDSANIDSINVETANPVTTYTQNNIAISSAANYSERLEPLFLIAPPQLQAAPRAP